METPGFKFRLNDDAFILHDSRIIPCKIISRRLVYQDGFDVGNDQFIIVEELYGVKMNIGERVQYLYELKPEKVFKTEDELIEDLMEELD